MHSFGPDRPKRKRACRFWKGLVAPGRCHVMAAGPGQAARGRAETHVRNSRHVVSWLGSVFSSRLDHERRGSPPAAPHQTACHAARSRALHCCRHLAQPCRIQAPLGCVAREQPTAAGPLRGSGAARRGIHPPGRSHSTLALARARGSCARRRAGAPRHGRPAAQAGRAGGPRAVLRHRAGAG